MKELKYVAAAITVFFLIAGIQGFAAPRPETAPTATAQQVSPRLTPEQALARFRAHNAEQAERLTSYRSQTVVTAELPDTAQHGEFDLVSTYTRQPRTLTYDNISYTGDGFVKTNVIARYLQSEVAHATKDDPEKTALSENNYSFTFKGSETINGHAAYAFQLKPHHKRVGLFKGKFYLNAETGSLLRMEGRLSKSPSLFIRSIEFSQDFEDINGFTLPTHLQSVTRTHLIGRAVVNVFHKAYQIGFGQSQAPAELSSNSSGNGEATR